MGHERKQPTILRSGKIVQPKGRQDQGTFSKVSNVRCGQRPQQRTIMRYMLVTFVNRLFVASIRKNSFL